MVDSADIYFIQHFADIYVGCGGDQVSRTYWQVSLNLLNKLGKKILSVFPNVFNNFSNTGAWMQDSIYHMTLKSHFITAVPGFTWTLFFCDLFLILFQNE